MAKILMIDDDPDIVMATRIPLEAEGHDFYVANTSAEGLEKITEVNPDLIILDVMMETVTEGFQLSLKLRDRSPGAEYAAYRQIPILMLTAVHTTIPLRFGPDKDYLPVDAFLDKSTDPDELLAKVKELLGKNELGGT
jgi:two-component system response regulator MprA